MSKNKKDFWSTVENLITDGLDRLAEGVEELNKRLEEEVKQEETKEEETLEIDILVPFKIVRSDDRYWNYKMINENFDSNIIANDGGEFDFGNEAEDIIESWNAKRV